MRRSGMRVLVAVAVVTAGGVAWTDLVAAAGKEINATIDPGKCDKTWGPPCFTPSNGTVTQVAQGETVTWKALDGTHTVTPVDPSAFTGSGDLTGPDGTFSVTFDKAGVFSFYCRHHGSVEDGGKTHHGMWGKIDVKAGETTTTTAPPAPPPSNDPPPNPARLRLRHRPPRRTRRPRRRPPPTGRRADRAPTVRGAAVRPPPEPAGRGSGRRRRKRPRRPPGRPSRSHRRRSRRTRPRRRSGSGRAAATASQPDPTAVPPDEAVLPPSPQFPTPTTAPLAEAPADVPHGDTIAVLKNEPGGRKRKLVLFGTLFGVGAFAAGVGGWKYMNRPSKYWPA